MVAIKIKIKDFQEKNYQTLLWELKFKDRKGLRV